MTQNSTPSDDQWSLSTINSVAGIRAQTWPKGRTIDLWVAHCNRELSTYSYLCPNAAGANGNPDLHRRQGGTSNLCALLPPLFRDFALHDH